MKQVAARKERKDQRRKERTPGARKCEKRTSSNGRIARKCGEKTTKARHKTGTRTEKRSCDKSKMDEGEKKRRKEERDEREHVKKRAMSDDSQTSGGLQNARARRSVGDCVGSRVGHTRTSSRKAVALNSAKMLCDV